MNKPMTQDTHSLRQIPCRIFDEDRNVVEFPEHTLAMEYRPGGNIITCIVCNQAEEIDEDSKTVDSIFGKHKPVCYKCGKGDPSIGAMNGLYFCSEECLYQYRKVVK